MDRSKFVLSPFFDVAATLLAMLVELGSVDGQAVASLASVGPFARDRRLMKGRRTIRAAKLVRTALSMVTLVLASRHNPSIPSSTNAFVLAARPRNSRSRACMRELLVIVNAMLASGTS